MDEFNFHFLRNRSAWVLFATTVSRLTPTCKLAKKNTFAWQTKSCDLLNKQGKGKNTSCFRYMYSYYFDYIATVFTHVFDVMYLPFSCI